MKTMETTGTQTRPHGYSANKNQLLARLARIEGQVRGVARMVEEDRYCIDIVTQISATEAALQKVSLGLLDGHARVCMRADGRNDDPADARVDELMGAIGRMLGR